MVLSCGSGLDPWERSRIQDEARRCYQHVIYSYQRGQSETSFYTCPTNPNYSLPRGNQKAYIKVQNELEELCPVSTTQVHTT